MFSCRHHLALTHKYILVDVEEASMWPFHQPVPQVLVQRRRLQALDYPRRAQPFAKTILHGILTVITRLGAVHWLLTNCVITSGILKWTGRKRQWHVWVNILLLNFIAHSWLCSMHTRHCHSPILLHYFTYLNFLFSFSFNFIGRSSKTTQTVPMQWRVAQIVLS